MKMVMKNYPEGKPFGYTGGASYVHMLMKDATMSIDTGSGDWEIEWYQYNKTHKYQSPGWAPYRLMGAHLIDDSGKVIARELPNLNPITVRAPHDGCLNGWMKMGPFKANLSDNGYDRSDFGQIRGFQFYSLERIEYLVHEC